MLRPLKDQANNCYHSSYEKQNSLNERFINILILIRHLEGKLLTNNTYGYKSEISRTKKIVIAFILIVAMIAVAALAVFIYTETQPYPTPAVNFKFQLTPLNTPDYNVTQGETIELNLTFTSNTNKQIIIPLENLSIISYNSTISYSDWYTSTWNKTVAEQYVFNYTFGVNQLTLQPSELNSTTLTINLAENAPTGRYELELITGRIIDPTSGLPYAESIPIKLIIQPK
jgi:hypothetical protein